MIFPFTGDGIGGSHVSAMTLIKELLKQDGLTVTLVAGEETKIAAEATRRGLHFFPSGERPIERREIARYVGGIPRRLRRLRRIRTSEPTVIHYNDLEAATAWQPAARILGLKSVYHHRALPRMTAMKRVLLGSMDHTIAISEICRDNLSFLSDDRVSVVANPIEIDVGSVSRGDNVKLVEELNITKDSIVFGFLGNFAHRKRPEFFVDVASCIVSRLPQSVFVMFGRDREVSREQMIARARSLGIEDRLHIAGFRSPVEANLVLLDVLLAPAVNEPFGRTLVEAALCRIPYVATEDAGHAEIARRWGGGVVVPKAASPKEFADIAVDALERRDALRLTDRDWEGLRSDVSASRHAAQVKAIYDAVSFGSGERAASR